ncbi:Uncharacterized protein P3T76_009239 [Phytophthora citrophthora]|uniref:Uncharacterized protein n=1 Tax=Phytophthora citrophthora TaxID=4793 RepID=A0AAD9GGM3_9STRA|nr:Uncharacterized protein P3T76_009239 [Phytophthora citrophthora]
MAFEVNTLSEDTAIQDERNSQSTTVQAAESKIPAEASNVHQTKKEPLQRPCRYFAKGKCRDSEKCKFSHEQNPKNAKHKQLKDTSALKEVREPKQTKKKSKCKYFAWNKCRNGDKCKFSHNVKKRGSNAKDHEPAIQSHAVVVLIGAPNDVASTRSQASSEWTDSQQLALDVALKKYPASMDTMDRWANIANDVDGHSLNDCIDRFKMLSELVRSGLDTASPSPHDDGAIEPTEQDARVARIIPPEQRLAIETESELTGTQIRLEDLFLHEIGTLVAHRVACQLQCENCPLTFDASLSLDTPEIQRWCPRCSHLHHVRMRPVFAHFRSDTLAYVDTKNCYIMDVLPSDMVATCLECDSETLLKKVSPSQRSEQTCVTCHTKIAVMAKRFLARHLESANPKRTSSNLECKQTTRKPKAMFVLGQPLPQFGACNHYRHSLRWFRFQCCGKAFPCNVCHDASECSKANIGMQASRMICGLCSKEQSSSVQVCMCGNIVGSKKTTTHHWEGGTGCRNYFLMSRWDKQKHRGQNKTESTKFSRVGVEAKRRRETAYASANTPITSVQ